MVKNLPKRKKEPYWREIKRQKKAKKKKKNIIFCFFLIGILVLTAFLFKAVKVYQKSVWQSYERINLVFPGCQPLIVFSYAKSPSDTLLGENGTLVAILIPSDTQIKVVHGYGDYRVEAIEKLEKLEKRKLLASSLEQALNLPINGFVKTGNCPVETKLENLKDFFSKSLLSGLLGETETNLTRWDLARLFWAGRKLNLAQVKKLDLQALSVLEKVILPDGSQVYKISEEKLMLITKEHFREESLRKEALAVEILNGTDEPGLAEKAARMLLNLGVEVVGLDNAPDRENCVLKGKMELKKTYTAKRLKAIFNCQFLKGEVSGADLSLILGREYVRKLKEK